MGAPSASHAVLDINAPRSQDGSSTARHPPAAISDPRWAWAPCQQLTVSLPARQPSSHPAIQPDMMMRPASIAASSRRTMMQQQLHAPRPRRLAMRVRAQQLPTFNFGNAATGSRAPRPENVPGPFFVDHTCIDCDTCRWMAPETFGSAGAQSAVHTQPTTRQGRVEALQALLSCPTFSIHATDRSPEELKAAQQGLPKPVPGTLNVFHCGWHGEASLACSSYLLVRPQGNVLIDSPRYNPVLAKRIEAMGGVKYMFLTHKDDVGDHAQWAAHFGAGRILHQADVVAGTRQVEHQLAGEGPWTLPDGSGDVELIHTPGHTRGCVCLYYGPDRAMFTGDHLAASFDDPEAASIFLDFNWFSVPRQVESVAKLLQYDFLHVLPGHGRRLRLRDAAHRLAAISTLVQQHQGSSAVATRAP